ncbi:IS1 transposase [Suttonella ornithocola]|uniref:IS1 transposase n=1 Tax=Suttonella ornithocola TaxID=279832 RepID=A0A380MPX1_9GAMM|nr:IS1 family transposase [Suttonella ornithocola]SUO94635.1 IS1 transposase [Suttonella ornithocola]
MLIEKASKYKVLNVLAKSSCEIKLTQNAYQKLQIDEFWTYVGHKKNKVWLIYTYDPEDSGEIVAFVWGKRHLKTAKQLRAKLEALGISFGCICCDNWDSFLTAFDGNLKKVDKQYTTHIEGNNNRFRQRLRRVFRKTCCFSKKLANHFKAFDLLFHYINYAWV